MKPKDAPAVQLDNQGYFSSQGRRIVPVGVNYWPASTGVEMWPRWPAAEIQHDLDVMAGLSLNCIRFFLRWPDFEPDEGAYDAAMLDKLRTFLGWCRQRRIWAHPSLFVGFMSGGLFWPKWKGKANIFADAKMRARSVAFAKRMTEVIAEFRDTVLAIDQGNEMCCLAESAAAAPEDVIAWCREVNDGIRAAWPDALIVNGCEQSQVNRDSGWRFGQQPGCDFYSMHGYPVPDWHSIGFDGMTDPLCQSLLPFYCKIARSFGPVMLQEFGTILTSGPRQQESYLRAVLEKSWANGANGFLWWCLRDIPARVFPYTYHGFEGSLGIVDAADRLKPGLECLHDFARDVATRPGWTGPAGDVGLWWPKHFYNRNQPAANNDPRTLSRHLIVANYLLEAGGNAVRMVRGDIKEIDPAVKTLVISSAMLAADEADALEPWLTAGGRLIWHAPDPYNFGDVYQRLLGAKAVDFRATRPCELTLFGRQWRFDTWPRGMRGEWEPVTAEVIARDNATGMAAVLRHRVGKGVVVAALPVVDDAIARVADIRPERDAWGAWYAGMLDLAR